MSNSVILSNAELEKVLANSECLINAHEINSAYDKLAAQLNLHYAGLNPLVLVVMNGGLIPAGQLLIRLNFFHRMEYIHVTRYKNNIGTNDLHWKIRPASDIKNEHILLIDDIFDEGITLNSVINELNEQQPASLKVAVLLNKLHDRKVKNFTPEFIGCDVADCYVYGCGMDYHGYLRHLPGVYAKKD